jgi:23S rRNA (cytosine1962-C5)-methyltransferase
MKKIILKKGKEKPILARHHWIFSGAVQESPSLNQGELVEVYSSSNQLLGTAYTNPKGSLLGRMVAFGTQSALSALKTNLEDAISLRKSLFNDLSTNSYRLVNGEGDRIPGLIIDRYHDHLCIQIGTKGIDLLKNEIVSILQILMPEIQCIYEKSDLPTRTQEGMKSFEGVLFGTLNPELIGIENGLKFSIDLIQGQKTGFFLDQREMRKLIASLAHNKTVTNCFSYSGGFSIYALKNGAKKVRSIDISKRAIELVDQNIKLNQIDCSLHEGICQDVFEFLKTDPLQEDIIILDPPAFAKKKEDIIAACRGYKEINRQAMLKMKKGALLLTASCSYHVDEKLFQQVLFQAALEAKREVKIITRHHLAMDHPINIFHPEGDYLKSFLLEIQ